MSSKLKTFLVIIVGLLFLTACGSTGGGGSKPIKNASYTTGWAYNDPDIGGFEVKTKYEQQTGPGLVLIEGGTFIIGRTEQDLLYDWNNNPRRVTVPSFYMDETEVRNVDYLEYLHWISRVFIEYPAVYKNALPDTLVWRSPLAYNEPLVEYYFRHPSYLNYPVVGVNWLQASDYCSWRTDRVNERILIDEGILEMDPNQVGEENFNTDAYLAGQYEGIVRQNLPDLDPNKEERRVRMTDGILLPKYRLPTEAEWEFAALALVGNTFEERIFERRMYPWDGYSIRNDVRKSRGKMRANFVRGRGDMMGIAGALNDNAPIPAQVDSYWPNDYGLYCMAGNVNEWVADVYRPLSFEDIEEFSPFRGNIFQTLVRDEDGNIAEKDSLGKLRWRPVTESEAIDRVNYQKAYYKNYLDGDHISSVGFADEDDRKIDSQRMYSQGDRDTDDFTTLISDRARTYKGGSWKDRVYWLTPGARRFLDEASSRDDLGFRCAMTRVGSPGGF